MNSYLTNSDVDIENIYKPNLEYLNDNFYSEFYHFPKNETIIKESLIFYTYYCYGEDEFEKEWLNYKEYNPKNKNHHYKGINYNFLNSNINFEIFQQELETRISYLYDKFMEDLEEKLKSPNFELPLMNNLKMIKESLVFLSSLDYSSNKIKDTVKTYFINSYINTINTLKDRYFVLYEKSFLVLADVENIMSRSKPIWMNIFIEEKDFEIFLYYLKNEIVNDYADLSYLYQKLKVDNKIVSLNQMAFNEWMNKNNLIKDVIYNFINDKAGFRTLAKSYSIERETKYNRLFKK